MKRFLVTCEMNEDRISITRCFNLKEACTLDKVSYSERTIWLMFIQADSEQDVYNAFVSFKLGNNISKICYLDNQTCTIENKKVYLIGKRIGDCIFNKKLSTLIPISHFEDNGFKLEIIPL